MMACALKFSAGAVRNQLRHNRRTIEHSSNRDIDPERLEHDYVLSPDRGMTEYDYFLQRKSELYCYNRDDVKVMVGWRVTAPQDLDPARYDDFFCTGTAEHGQKIQELAEAAGISPKEYVDGVAAEIKRIWDLMNTS